MSGVRGLGRGLRSEVVDRRRVRRRVRACRARLRPGWWVVVSRDRAVHVRAAGSAVRAGGLRGLLRLLVGLPWSLVTVGGDGARAGEDVHTQLVVGAKDLILVAERRHLLRVSDRVLADDDWVAARTAVARHLATPGWEVAEDGRAIREEFVDGPLVSSQPIEQQRRDCARVLAACRSLVAAEVDRSTRPATALVDEALAAVERLGDRVPRGLRDGVAALRAADHTPARDGPLVPAHADLKTTNLVRRGEEVVAIDLEYASWQPFHLDTLNLATNMVRTGVADPAAVRTALANVFAAAGLAGGDGPDEADLDHALVAFAALRSHRYALRGIDLDDDARVRSLQWSWRLVRPALAR